MTEDLEEGGIGNQTECRPSLSPFSPPSPHRPPLSNKAWRQRKGSVMMLLFGVM